MELDVSSGGEKEKKVCEKEERWRLGSVVEVRGQFEVSGGGGVEVHLIRQFSAGGANYWMY